jgi:hypothetical protein
VVVGLGAVVPLAHCLVPVLGNSPGITFTWPFLLMALILVGGAAMSFVPETALLGVGAVGAVMVLQCAAGAMAIGWHLQGRGWLFPYPESVGAAAFLVASCAVPLGVLARRWLLWNARWHWDRRAVAAAMAVMVGAGVSSWCAWRMAPDEAVGAGLRMFVLAALFPCVAIRQEPARRHGILFGVGLVSGLLMAAPGFPRYPQPVGNVPFGYAAVSVAAGLTLFAVYWHSLRGPGNRL